MTTQPDKPAFDDGGPAFPTHNTGDHMTPNGIETWQQYAMPGMSLRQWYAGLAMQAVVRSSLSDPDMVRVDHQIIAETALDYADALLAAERRTRGEQR